MEQLYRTGVPTDEEIENTKPPKEIRERGPVAVIECFQEIPCDPCYTYCKFGAIKPFEDINDLPEIDYEKCNGCSVCISHCPGLAVFLIDETYSDDTALIMIPHEFCPLPEVGETVSGLSREGEVVTDAKVVKARSPKKGANVLSLEVPKEFAYVVRSIKRK